MADKCIHCGKETKGRWSDPTVPFYVPICYECINAAEVGHYATPAYERVGQKTYESLIKWPQSEEGQ